MIRLEMLVALESGIGNDSGSTAVESHRPMSAFLIGGNRQEIFICKGKTFSPAKKPASLAGLSPGPSGGFSRHRSAGLSAGPSGGGYAG
jgi:hypothetical protein